MRSRSDLQVVFGSRDPHLLKEHLRHIPIVVLTSMDDDFAQSSLRFQRARNGRRLDELWPCTKYAQYFHGSYRQRFLFAIASRFLGVTHDRRAGGRQIRATGSVETVERGTLDEARCATTGFSRQLCRNM